jgi:hypothetical protein
MRDVFDGAVIALECLGEVHVAEHKFLDCVTEGARVKLSPNVDPPFTGAHWHCMSLGDGSFALASAGHNFGRRYLDGRTQDGAEPQVASVGDTLPPFSGTRWKITEQSPGVVTIECLGDFKNPNRRFLDGRTQDGVLLLAATTDPPFTGTRWGTRLLATPSFEVSTQHEAIRSRLKMVGRGFTPGDPLHLDAEGIHGRQDHAPFPLGGPTTVGADGAFEAHADVGFFPTHPAGEPVTIRATDRHGITATDTSDGFAAFG